ncbi:MAG: 16S rRNA (adenine(1518)-N(6)/adenine(1519)-N(6))-dimethyltransferase RsmA [Emergencia sp.]
MMNLYAPSTIREIKDKYDFKLSKSLGQNFLTDKNIIDKIIDATEITEEDLVIEIGPGIGVLTAEAAQLAKKVVAVEIDKNLIPILQDTLSAFDNVEIINQDVLKTDLNRIIHDSGCRGVKIIGNLPYYITTPIIMGILESHVQADSITIMMQKEVADRIKSGPGTKAYGALSVAVQYYCTVSTVAIVPKEVFFPAPKVDSAVLKLNLRKERPVDLIDEKLFFRCIKAGFGQRRKTLSNSLMQLGDISKSEVLQGLQAAGIEEKRRAETLSLEEFAVLANCFAKGEK